MKLIATSNALTANLKDWDVAKALFPAYSVEQLKELADYIKSQKSVMGLPPVVISKDGRIVDGYNRVSVYRSQGLETTSVLVYEYRDDSEMEAHAIDLNAKRRHLDAVTASKMALRLAELRKPSKAETKEKQSKAKKDNKNASKNNSTTTVVQLNSKASSRKSSLDKAAKEVGVSPHTARQMKAVQESKDKALISAVESKEISIAKGAELAKVSASSRPGLLSAAKSAMKSPKKVCKVKGNKAEYKISCVRDLVDPAVKFDIFISNFIGDSSEYLRIASQSDLEAIHTSLHILHDSIDKALGCLEDTFPCLNGPRAKGKGAA